MKKSLLLGITGIALVALTATTLYAQTVAGTSLVDKMKEAVRPFSLSAVLNGGQAGFESAPIAGKKTGGILTAGEWNRVLELLGQGGGGLQISFKKDYSKDGNSSVPATENIGSHDFCALTRYGEGALSDSTAGYCKVEKGTSGPWTVSIQALNNNINCQVTCFTGGGGGTSSGWVDVPLTDTTPFDKTCEYRFTINTNGDNASIGGTNPIFYAAAVDPFAITYVSHSSVISHILASSKNVFRNNGTSVYTVTKIEKLCGGGSGGSSSELQLSNESPTTAPNFIEATKYCKNLTEGGYSDWRFPNLSELFVFAPISTDTNFLWTNAVDYSQGTANANPGYWGKLRMSDGYFSATSGPGDDVAYVRCVRGS